MLICICMYPVLFQYYADANEADSWMTEIEPVVSSRDYGRDENSANTLLQSHERVENEVKAYSSELERLKELSRKLFERSAQSGMVRSYLIDSCIHWTVFIFQSDCWKLCLFVSLIIGTLLCELAKLIPSTKQSVVCCLQLCEDPCDGTLLYVCVF